MKRIIILMVFLSAGLLFTNDVNAKLLSQSEGGVYFYSSLSPYGSWIQISGGVTVWRPVNVSSGWAPYRNGQWIWTDDGWYWESYEPFGYITYHYGRWYYDDNYGWIWIPDNQWAPAWVEWRYDNDYIGWAPLPPYAGFSISIGIHFTTNYYLPYYRWHFVRYKYICDPYVYNYFVPQTHVYRFYSRTKYRTNYGYSDGRVINRGVDIDFVRKRSGQNIREREIERVSDPREIRNQNERNSDRVRSYYIGRDKLTRENVDERTIERSDKRSSLDFSRIGVGGRGTIESRNDNNNRNVRPNDRGNLDNRRENLFREKQGNENNNGNFNRGREFNKERNNRPDFNNDRPNVRHRNENPFIRQGRTEQRPEMNRGNRQPERSGNNRGNERNKSGHRDGRGRIR